MVSVTPLSNTVSTPVLASAPTPAIRLGDRPLYATLVQFPVVCFVGTLLTDIAYWKTELFIWETFSVWLLAVGCVMAGVAGVVGLVYFVADRRSRAWPLAWPHALVSLAAALLSVVNAFVHSRDGYTAVVPDGLVLSAVVVLLMLLATALGWRRMASARRVVVMGAAAVGTAATLAACGADGGSTTLARADGQYGNAPELPAPHNYLVPPMKIAPAGSWAPGETPTVASGLKVEVLATGLMHPRMVYTLPNGDILVAESNGPKAPINRPKDLIMGFVKGFGGTGGKGGNRITLIRPANGSTPPLQTVLIDHLNSPFGIALVGHDLYVANTDSLMRYPYADGDTRITAPGTKLADLPAGQINHHWTKSLLASADGTKLYVGVGSNSNITENGMPAEMNRACILEVDRATGATRVFADGLRNPNAMQWEPQSHKMWAVVNERDEIGPNLVPDYLTSVQEGGFYGWPFSYYGAHVDPRVMPQRPDLVAKAISPDYALGSHVAPLGLAFNGADAGTGTSTTLAGAFSGNGAFIGEHGSWDRSPLSGYKVVFVPFKDGRPAGPPQDVVTGFVRDNGKANGRPVGLALDKSGGLVIADDIGNAVWRVSATKG